MKVNKYFTFRLVYNPGPAFQGFCLGVLTLSAFDFFRDGQFALGALSAVLAAWTLYDLRGSRRTVS